jgi:hypothetical protein
MQYIKYRVVSDIFAGTREMAVLRMEGHLIFEIGCAEKKQGTDCRRA